jgi:hypothetical protein
MLGLECEARLPLKSFLTLARPSHTKGRRRIAAKERKERKKKRSTEGHKGRKDRQLREWVFLKLHLCDLL